MKVLAILALLAVCGCSRPTKVPEADLRAAGVNLMTPAPRQLTPEEYLKLLRAKAREKHLGFDISCSSFTEQENWVGWAYQAGHRHVFAEEGASEDWWVYKAPTRDEAVRLLYEAISGPPKPPSHKEPESRRQCLAPITQEATN